MLRDVDSWDFESLSQQQLATILQIDRGTVRRYQGHGMPYTPAQKGLAASFCSACSIHWLIGHKWSIDAQVKLTARQKIILSYAHLCSGDDPFTKADFARLKLILDRAGLWDRTEMLLDMGYTQAITSVKC